MGQKTNAKRTKATEARAYGKYISGSAQKLNLLAQMIRGKKAGRALVDLQFSKRRVAQDVRKVLQSAIANAENNHNLDVDRLIVAEATVGKTLKLKRFHARGRGRAASVEKKFSNISITVREADETVKAKKPKESSKKEGAKSAARKSGTAADKPKTKSPAKKAKATA
jgi:large subunit ribosomal protein L22